MLCIDLGDERVGLVTLVVLASHIVLFTELKTRHYFNE